MDIQSWTYLLVFSTFALYIAVAIWARAGSTKDFYIAGGGVSPLMNGMATPPPHVQQLVEDIRIPKRS